MEKITKVAETLIRIVDDDTTPSWAKVLIGCVSELVDAVKAYNVLNERFVKLESLSEVRGQIIESLQNDNANLKKDIASARQAADCNEQKSRSQCLLIHGVDESAHEDTDKICLDIISEHIGVSITLNDIERTHRIGPKNPIKLGVVRNQNLLYVDLLVSVKGWRSTETKRT